LVLHELYVELRQSGSVVRIRGHSRAIAVAAAVELGRMSVELGFVVEVID